ncbi:placenta-specific gene 8 protein isoform X1 [Pogona vitticeps]
MTQTSQLQSFGETTEVAFRMNPQQVIVTQPQVVVVQRQQSQWQTDICDCFSDCGVCLCGFFCYPCLGCQVASDMGECCLCGTSWAMRSVYRTRYGIQGSLCGDFCTALWCPVCSLCQIKRDINRRRQLGIF